MADVKTLVEKLQAAEAKASALEKKLAEAQDAYQAALAASQVAHEAHRKAKDELKGALEL